MHKAPTYHKQKKSPSSWSYLSLIFFQGKGSFLEKIKEYHAEDLAEVGVCEIETSTCTGVTD